MQERKFTTEASSYRLDELTDRNDIPTNSALTETAAFISRGRVEDYLCAVVACCNDALQHSP